MMKKWVFFIMAFFTFTLVSCNSSTTLPSDTLPNTTLNTTITTNNGTITEETMFQVEFDSGGSALIPTQGVIANNLVDEPTISRTGYSLDGWYLSEDNGVTFIKKWNFQTDKVTSDIELYALWNVNQYTISFITNGGLALEPINQDFGSEVILEEPIKSDYQFDGWFLDEELTNPYQFTTMPAYDLTLYAKWIPSANTFELHYYLLPEGYNPITDEVVTEVPEFISVSTKSYFTVALTRDYQVYTWGYNEYYQLGNGQFANRNLPTNITSNFHLGEEDYIIQVKAGYMHSIALSNEGKVYTWGDNEDGQLGVGNTDVYTLPVDITDNFGLLVGEKIISIDSGNYHSSALSSSGRFFMWGDNSVGQLATEEYSDTTLPNEVTSVFALNENEVIMITALGGNHSLALTSENRVFSWGFNFGMQLGDGTNVSRTTPLDITANFNLGVGEEIVKIAAGNNHSGAVSSLGNIYTFGLNTYGQLGNGNTTNQSLPVNITNQFTLETNEEIIDIFMGVHFSSCITNQQNIFTWGLNDVNQLGDESFINRTTPIDISNLFDFNETNEITCVAMGNGYISIVDEMGEMYLWGDNYLGQIGIGTYIDQSTPINPKFWVPEIIVFTYNEDDTYNLYIPERVDDTFIGWYTDPALTIIYEYVLNPDGPTILYSKWESFPAILVQESAFLEPDGYHYYTFTITDTAYITIYTVSELDTYGVLMDDGDNVIEENDDGDIDYNFYISYTLEAGTYTVEVSGYDETETGPYDLFVIKN